ncbi:Acetylcholinesterase [Holothuria leucospilota]|uniref:Acetylcholinesterase n=1 Tax=Holothuria leucospilota TaxID=206669 RepID=A0A9Q1C0I0_HOLLE|nr:Acetylcholinesterase [Holothuria leucospilota]
MVIILLYENFVLRPSCFYFFSLFPFQGSSYPVFIRIHGGGFIQGSGNDASYDGRPIVSLSDVVFVSMNYRLGAFGFLATGLQIIY